MKNHVYMLKTISSLHCGVGSGKGDIDLPVAKSPVTGLPIVPGTSLKGVMKSWFQNQSSVRDSENHTITALFGPKDSEHASAISIGDASLVCLPVRSFFGGFAWLTSPLALGLYRQALERVGTSGLPALPKLENPLHYHAMVTPNSALKGAGLNNQILLEELDLIEQEDPEHLALAWAKQIGSQFFSQEDDLNLFIQRFVVANDDVLNFLCETALPVDPHIAINSDTGIVRSGALWYEENVPPESIFYGSLSVDRGYDKAQKDADTLSAFLAEHMPSALQVGGKATTGKGLVSFSFHA